MGSRAFEVGENLGKSRLGSPRIGVQNRGRNGPGLILSRISRRTARRLAEFDNSLRLDPKIIRHLIAKTPKNYEWVEYSGEDLEHDFTKLESVIAAKEERNAKKSFGKKTFVRKGASKPVAKKVEKKADSGVINKKLDDILADL